MPRLMLPILIALLALVAEGPAGAQAIALDRGVRAGGLWCFPVATNPKEYVYLPADARLGTDRNGGPEFSFLRYVENTKPGGAGAESITEAGGGGVLQFLALYETPPARIAAAEKALKELTEDPDARLRGPLVFTGGRYAVISSILPTETPSGGDAAPQPARRMVGSGNAPVLEGSKVAVSFGLEKREVQILDQSFRMANPDITVVFEMQFSGLTEAYDAELEVDWAEVRKDRQFQLGVRTPWVGVEVETAFQRLLRNNAIRLKTRGDNAPSQALMNAVYNRLVELMFHKTDEPAPIAPPPDTLTALLKQAVTKIASFSLTGGYRMKDLKTEGRAVIRMNHRSAVTRTALITFNIGDLHRRYGKDPAYFRIVNLDDPAFKQREVRIGVDGTVLNDFERYVNSVTVTLRKVHQNGETTLREIVVNRDTFTRNPQGFAAVYGWHDDRDRTAWLTYEYRTTWSFRDGGTREEEWRKTDNPAINVLPPYERREVTISGDLEALKRAGVRHAVVTLGYDFFGKPRNLRPVVLRVGETAPEEKVELIQPRGDYRYRYEIRWHMADGRQVSKPAAVDTSGLILVDEMPE